MPAVIIAFGILGISLLLLVITIGKAVAARRRQQEQLDSVEKDLTGRYRGTRKVYRKVHGKNPPGWNTEQFLTALKDKK